MTAMTKFCMILLAVLAGLALAKAKVLDTVHRHERSFPSGYCGREFRELEGSFSSSSVCGSTYYPNNALYNFTILPDNIPSNCSLIKADISIYLISVERNSDCTFDYVYLLAGFERFPRICGQNTWYNGSVCLHRSSSLQVYFQSDYSIVGEGFEVVYALSCVDGELTPSSSECMTFLQNISGTNSSLPSGYTTGDYTSPTSSYTSTTTGYPSTTSDNPTTSNFNNYEVMCGLEYGGPSGSFGSADCSSLSGSPDAEGYVNNAYYRFRLRTDEVPGNCSVVTAHFEINMMYIEEAPGCRYDALQVLSVPGLDKFCGVRDWDNLTLCVKRGDPVDFLFTSDFSITGQGFYVNYSLVCADCRDAPFVNANASAGYPFINYTRNSFSNPTTTYAYTTRYPHYTTPYYTSTGYPSDNTYVLNRLSDVLSSVLQRLRDLFDRIFDMQQRIEEAQELMNALRSREG